MAPAWRAAPLPKAHCAAAAAIEATATEPWTEAQLLQELDAPAGRLFGLYAGETLCGAAVFQLAADEASLESVTIAPEHRGKGAGRALLTHALAAALCFLEVRAHNAPALALYAALGFESVGRRKNFYKNPPEDALVMRAEL